VRAHFPPTLRSTYRLPCAQMGYPAPHFTYPAHKWVTLHHIPLTLHKQGNHFVSTDSHQVPSHSTYPDHHKCLTLQRLCTSPRTYNLPCTHFTYPAQELVVFVTSPRTFDLPCSSNSNKCLHSRHKPATLFEKRIKGRKKKGK
jgi:hypothetical protein